MLRRKIITPSSSPFLLFAPNNNNIFWMTSTAIRSFHTHHHHHHGQQQKQQQSHLQQQQPKRTTTRTTFADDDGSEQSSLTRVDETYDSRQEEIAAQQKRKTALSSIEDDVVAMASERGFFSVSQSTSQATNSSSSPSSSSDDPASRFKSSAAEDFFVDLNLRRKRLKPTFQQLEFPSGMTERISSTSVATSRVGALYQLHYSDTNVRELLKIETIPDILAVRLHGISSNDYLLAKTWLEKEASGQENNFVKQRQKEMTKENINEGNDSSSFSSGTLRKFDRDAAGEEGTTAKEEKGEANQLNRSSDSDLGFIFTLYTENITTEGALNTIAARFGCRKSDIQTLRQYSKDQCTTQIAWAKSAVLCREQILALNLMSFPGFCIRTCFNYQLQIALLKNEQNLNQGQTKKFYRNAIDFELTRREFSFGTSLKLHRNEVTTLLRRVQVGNEDAARSLLNEIQETGAAINYYSHITQESFIYGLRRLQEKKFKSAVLQLLRHKNIRPELREFIKNPSQHSAAIARKAIGNETVRGMLRVLVETDSYYRTIEASPGDYRNLMYRSGRKVAWNTMASKRIRSEIVSAFHPGSVQVKLRVGDFVLINKTIRDQMNSSGDSSTPGIHLQDVMFLETEEDIVKCQEEFGCTEKDIVLPVPSFDILNQLLDRFPISTESNSPIAQNPKLHPANFMKSCLRETKLLGLVETPELWEAGHWKYIMNIQNVDPTNVVFRRLLMNTEQVFSTSATSDDITNDNNNHQTEKAKIVVALDPAPTPTTIFDCSRLLLNDRLLLQAGRRNNSGVLDRYVPADANIAVDENDSQNKDSKSNTAAAEVDDDDDKELEKYLKDVGLSVTTTSEAEQTATESTSSSSLASSKKVVDGLQVDSLISSKLLKKKQTKSSCSENNNNIFFDFANKEEEAELRQKLKLPPPPIDVEKLSWAISDSNFSSGNNNNQAEAEDDSSSSSPLSSFRPATPISDTSRLTSVVTVLLQLQLPPSILPTLLRETINLHGVMSDEEARLQQKIHMTIRGIDTEDKSVWSKDFCPICFSLEHSQSSECPIHQRRVSVRMAKRERVVMAKSSQYRRDEMRSRQEREENEKRKMKQEQEQEQQKQEEKTTSPNQSTTHLPVNMKSITISRSANSKNKWGVKVDRSLILAEGCEQMQPTLKPFVVHDNDDEEDNDEWKIVRVGSVPVATFEQLKLALAGCNSTGEAELILKKVE